MLAIHRHGAPLNKMTIKDCLRVLENDCDPESARDVAWVLRQMADEETIEGLQERIEELEAEVEDLESQRDEAESDTRDAENRAEDLEEEVEELKERIAELEDDEAA